MNDRYWAVVPAAGLGKRLGGAGPKQYLKILNKTICEHTLEALLAADFIQAVLVALHAEDTVFKTLPVSRHQKIQTVPGGFERSYSVWSALCALENQARLEDWVLVHDVARPCITGEDILALVRAVADHPVGGLLGVPVIDSLKRVDENLQVKQSVARENLWRAFTPQMFRYGQLKTALETAHERGVCVQDEAQALSRLGYQPLMVQGREDNIKITYPADLAKAQRILESRHD